MVECAVFMSRGRFRHDARHSATRYSVHFDGVLDGGACGESSLKCAETAQSTGSQTLATSTRLVQTRVMPSDLRDLLGDELLDRMRRSDSLAPIREEWLSELTVRLVRTRTKEEVRAWFLSPNGGLVGLSPVQALAGDWLPDDDASAHLLKIACRPGG